MANNLPMIRSPFDWLREEIDHTFDRWLPRRPEMEREGRGLARTFWENGMPQINMDEDEKEITVTAEMPGLEKDDFKVELRGDQLTITGEKKYTHEEKKRNTYYSELSYGSFSRVIPLPAEVDASKVEATYKNGLLTLRLPKSEQAKPVEVKVAA